ncbi:hypothetical protein ACMFMG_005110 [Clarireedia jacksonii]
MEDLDERSRNYKKEKRAFPCQYCAKKFLRNEHLQRHERLHTKENPFSCTVCSAAFTRRDLLARHLRLSHNKALADRFGSDMPSSHHVGSPEHAGYIPNASNSMTSHVSRQGHQVAYNDSHMSLPDASSPGVCRSLCSDTTILNISEAPAAPSVEIPVNASYIQWPEPTHNFDDFALFIDSMSIPYPNDLSTMFAEQPFLPLSPSPLFGTLENQPLHAQWQDQFAVPPHMTTTTTTSAPHLFDEFSSTFPSFETSSTIKSKQEPCTITQQDWDNILADIQRSILTIPPGFSLPSRHTMTRYIATYFSGFHRHLPFLHIPTFLPTACPVDLILSMAAIGAQSSFDNDNAVMLFRAAYSIIMERLRYHKAELRKNSFPIGDKLSTESRPPDQLPLEHSSSTARRSPDSTENGNYIKEFDALPAAQTLLLLMAMATWGNSKAIYNEAITLQNILANFVREEKFLEAQIHTPEDINWCQWARVEGFKRTIAIIFCFFVFHTIVYDTPPPILNSELKIHLPCGEIDWATRSEKDWQELRRRSEPEPQFQSYFSLLFSMQSDESNENPKGYSSFGGYILILALIQHIYYLREMSKCKPGSDKSLSSTDVAAVEQALRNWQNKWYMDPESSLGPGSPQGPISFNSTALLRMAYIRLNVDVGPWRALNTHDPHKIAMSIHQSPHLKSTHKLRRAVLYSAHALSIPIKIGVNIVARNQASAWSLQHSLCALECAFVLSKWLIAVQNSAPGVPLDEEEVRLVAYITDMVTEADPGSHSAISGEVAPHRHNLCTQVIKIWAKILSGEVVWDVVQLIGKTLEAYGQILETQSRT